LNEDSNLLNSPKEGEDDNDTMKMETRLIYEMNNLKSNTPLQSPTKRKRISHIN